MRIRRLWSVCCVLLLGASLAARAHAAAAAASSTAALGGLPSLPSLLPNISFSSGQQLGCLKSKPTLVLISGVGGSQMSGTFTGSDQCAPLTNTTVVWYADKWFWGRQLKCWSHLMSMQYDASTGRWSNSTGTQLWPDEGRVMGEFPEQSKQKLFYAFLLKHLLKEHGYVPGKDFFIIPYDWRIGVQGLEQHDGLRRITERISAGVAKNCGQKAIVMSHSYGANVIATIFQKPEFARWREDTVRGWIPVGAPFGGCAATPWLSMLSGDFFKLFPIMSNLLPPSLTGKWHPTVVGKSVYNFAFGLPSWGWMLPRGSVLGDGHVIVQTPSKNYTVAEQKQIMLDMGDAGGASILDDSWSRSEKIVERGPVPGVETWCLYSTGVPTSMTLVFNETVRERQALTRPYKIITGPGDGVVDITSLQLCKKFAPESHVVEVSGPLVDHATILSHPLGLKKLSEVLHKLGVPYTQPVKRLVSKIVSFDP